MRRTSFLGLVTRAYRSLPPEFLAWLQNVAILVEDAPTREQLRENGVRRGTLLGLYEGVPQTEREGGWPLLPDRITLFQDAIEAEALEQGCSVFAVIRTTLAHEIGHHFGLDEAAVRALEAREAAREHD
ncbi:MAG: metallopeptidase family protein [Patescibacteria group bacterium]|jgi:predicted Zn-dependent protease with MMP-like domain